MHEPNEEEEQTKEDDAEDEDLKAPVEMLWFQFLGALMDKDFQLAHKLCQMILIHEPDNPEASEFLPLIHKKLLEGEKDSDDDDGNSGSDEESSQSSSCSSSSRSSSSPSDDDAEKEEAQVNRHKPCPPSHICP
uniref:Glutamate rich 2 n=1 Tax=Seriola lalandi dorsalis TaxID=1841481 RepID=A0A3B4WT82_SERLL